MRIAEELKDCVVPHNSLKQWPGNPKAHDLEMIANSLDEHGQYRPCVVQKSTGRIVIGNGMWEAAGMLEAEEIAAVFVDVDDRKAEEMVLLDNRSHDKGGYIDELLADMLSRLQNDETGLGLSGTGYTDDDLSKMLTTMADELDEHLPEPGDAESVDLEEVWGVVITANDEQHQVELLERFTAEGLKVKAMMT